MMQKIPIKLLLFKKRFQDTEEVIRSCKPMKNLQYVTKRKKGQRDLNFIVEFSLFNLNLFDTDHVILTQNVRHFPLMTLTIVC